VTTTSASAPASTAAARTEDLVKVYGQGETQVTALDHVDVSFETGRFTAIMGPSGSGKSTLMHCVAGLDTITSGRIYIGDVELGSLNDKQLTRLRRDTVGFVFQAFNLVPTLTAGENITLPMDLAGRAPDPEWFDTVVRTVGLEDRLSHRPSELSGGQQQRVAVARALAHRPVLEPRYRDVTLGHLVLVELHVAPGDLVPGAAHLVLHPLPEHEDGRLHVEGEGRVAEGGGVLVLRQVAHQLGVRVLELGLGLAEADAGGVHHAEVRPHVVDEAHEALVQDLDLGIRHGHHSRLPASLGA